MVRGKITKKVTCIVCRNAQLMFLSWNISATITQHSFGFFVVSFFYTPQIMQNEISNKIILSLSNLISLLLCCEVQLISVSVYLFCLLILLTLITVISNRQNKKQLLMLDIYWTQLLLFYHYVSQTKRKKKV